MTLHAKSRPPSSAGRWVHCPGSATVCQLYPNDSSSYSVAGDVAHALLENAIRFGIAPDTADADMDMNIRDVTEWVAERVAEYGSGTQVFAERRYDIAETGEFGTCDISIVGVNMLHIGDYKNGYVFTDAREQMLTYLLGAIATYGERPRYRTTVIQPNYNHRDGSIRTVDVSPAEVEQFRLAVREAVASTAFVAGPWCKKTYCDHRGSCVTFKAWCETTGDDAWYPHEVNAMDDETLAQALDHSDILHGVRDSYRKEAMRRIAQHDKRIPGYKLVRSRQDRDFAGDEGRAACYAALIEMGFSTDDLVERKHIQAGPYAVYEAKPLTVPGVERMVKQKYKTFKRGTWKQVWDEHFRPHIREYSANLTLEREIDGRPAHTRGSEFGSLVPAQHVTQVI